jgi:hypothetical protein
VNERQEVNRCDTSEWSEGMTDLSGAIWRKASGSAHNGGCVEVAGNLPGVTAIRDSKRPECGALVIDRAVFAAFLTEVRRGRYDAGCSAEPNEPTSLPQK